MNPVSLLSRLAAYAPFLPDPVVRYAKVFLRYALGWQTQKSIDVKKLALIVFPNAWEGVYLPLFEELEKHGFQSQAHGWTEQVSRLLQTHHLWFEEGSFHFAKKGCCRRRQGDEKETFVALVSLALSCKQHPQIKSIYSLLIKPFRALIPPAVYQAYYWQIQVALFRAYNEPHQRSFNDIPFQDTENRAAVLFQRVYRAHLYRKRGLISESVEPHYILHLPRPQIPQAPKRVDAVLAQRWVEAHPPEWRGTAQKVIRVLTYRSFAKFKQRLKQAVESFNEKLMSLPAEKRKFIIVVPDPYKERSYGWVTALALPFFTLKPVDVLLSSQVSAFKEQHPDISNVVFLDDALFSGKQIQTVALTLRRFSCYMIVPFMTSAATRKLSESRIWFSQHERMLGLTELATFSEEELQQIKGLTGSYDPNYLDQRSLTWLDHKIADSVSTLDTVLKYGKPIAGHSWVRFIQETEFSYFPKGLPQDA